MRLTEYQKGKRLMLKSSDWSIESARNIYNIHRWSDGYFDINEAGDLIAKISNGSNQAEISLNDIISQLKKEGLTLPVLIRFSDILRNRIMQLNEAFSYAKQNYDYEGDFRPVYPIKVNQQRRVVEEILKSDVGLEAGSKPELMAVLALNAGREQLIICNGYKDREFIRLALVGRVLGHRIFIIIEKLSELNLVIEESKKLGIEPLLGLRSRLTTIGKGKWQNTGGEKSKFGLTTYQILKAIEHLKEAGYLPSLKLLHCHLGSQVANIHEIEVAMQEFASLFSECYRLGAPLEMADVGGGLGIDYEGTRSRNDCSVNYSFREYADVIVKTMAKICDEKQIQHPAIITESGRAMVAHHAVLITQVIDYEAPAETNLSLPEQIETTQPDCINQLWALSEQLKPHSWSEIYHVAKSCIAQTHLLFAQAKITIESRAFAESLFNKICRTIQKELTDNKSKNRELLDELNEKLAYKLFCNFSLFQSIPDAWAIDQIFPIMPLKNLNVPPSYRAVIQDMTCDSDGRINQYVDGEGIERSLPIPPFFDHKEYLLGIFLVGAYQEILGDLHNLFGDTDSVHVEITEHGTFQLVEPVLGDRVEKVLSLVNFDPQRLMRSYKLQLESVPLNSEIKRQYLDMLSSGLNGYTYLEEEN